MKVFEAFAGIGAQHKALSNLKNKRLIDKFEVLGIAEWDLYANRVYAAIHNDYKYNFTNEQHFKNDKSFVENNVVSRNSKTAISKIAVNRMKEDEAKQIMLEYKNNNNISDVNKLKDSSKDYLKDVEILTYSFPCQDLSLAGSIHGYNKGIKEGTRSGLLLEIEKSLSSLHKDNKELPKCLVMENVKNLLNKNHKESFENWLEKLESFGYSTYWGVLNSHDYGCIQKRERVFAISILDNKSQSSGDLKELVKGVYDRHKNFFPNERIKDVIDFEKNDETINALLKKTPSRKKMVEECSYIDETTTIVPTVTTKQDRFPNTGLISTNMKKEGYFSERLLTPRETFKLMGFSNEDYDIARSVCTMDSKLYRMAGNSIVVRVLELIFLVIDEMGFVND